MGKKKDKKEAQSAETSPADGLRSAVESAIAAAFGGAASTRGRAQELVDEIGTATSRVREVLDDLRVLEDLRGLRTEIQTLATRVAALEVQLAAKSEPKPKPAPRRVAAPRASAGTKPAGTRSRSTPRKTPGAPADPAPPTETADDASAGRS